MSIFAELKSKLDQAITGVNRYNPNNVDTLESCIEAMVQENQYDKDILVTTLKLYQLNPDKFVFDSEHCCVIVVFYLPCKF